MTALGDGSGCAMTDFVAAVDAYVLTGATLVLAVATWQLAKTARRQTEIMREGQQRTLDRDKPKIELQQCGTTIVRQNLDDPVGENKHFHGFIAVNAGAVPVTVVGVAPHFAVKAGNTMERRQIPDFPPATEWQGVGLGTGPVPVKLNPGDAVTVPCILLHNSPSGGSDPQRKWKLIETSDSIQAVRKGTRRGA